MLVYLLRFLFGYVRISVCADYPERFLNVCAAADLKLWGYTKKGDRLLVNAAAADYFKMRKLRKGCGARLRLVSKRGVPFILRGYRGKAGIAAGLAAFFAVQIVLSQFIWNVKINGNKAVKESEITAACKAIGIGEGTLAAKVDTNDARLRLLLTDSRLSWASFIVEGSCVTVNVLEEQRRAPNNTDPANFVAKCDGVVERVTVKAGKPIVKRGQAVLKGELLASGVIEYTDGSTVFTRCSGEITAKTEHDIFATVPLIKTEKLPTGKKYTRRAVDFFGLRLPLGFAAVPEGCKRELTRHKITRGEAYAPITLFTAEFREYKTVKRTLTKAEAAAEGRKMLSRIEKNDLKQAEIVARNDVITVEGDSLTLKRHIKCTENIAISENIKINTVKMQKNVVQ